MRVAAQGVDVVFTATIKNFGRSAATKLILEALYKSKDNFIQTHQADTPLELQPGQEVVTKFTMAFTLTDKDRDPEYITVRAMIKCEAKDGLPVDDVRDVVLKIQKKVPILVIDGAAKESKDGEDNTFIDQEKNEFFYRTPDDGDWKTLAAGLEVLTRNISRSTHPPKPFTSGRTTSLRRCRWRILLRSQA